MSDVVAAKWNRLVQEMQKLFVAHGRPNFRSAVTMTLNNNEDRCNVEWILTARVVKGAPGKGDSR